MDILIIVSSNASGEHLRPLTEALARSGRSWGAFFTNKGVSLLEDPAIVQNLADATASVACKESWSREHGDAPCPITLGSQTNNSGFVGDAARTLSL